LPATTPFR
jgi:hypothetical protein